MTGWLNSIHCGVGGGTCSQNQSYLYDLVGNVTQRQNNNLGLTENFYYDNLYRLDYSQLNGVTNLDLTYDAMGNITKRSDIANSATWTYSSTHKHQVLQAGSSNYTYSYDANGNAITRNGYAITWNKYNYPTQINGNGESTSLFYDANQTRWKQVYTNTNTETTLYVGGLLEKVSSNGVDDYRHYVYANGQLVAVMSRPTQGTAATNFVLHDALGSVSKITDGSGADVVSESFTAFGTRRNPQTWSGVPTNGDQVASNNLTRQGFTGQDALGNLGLNHMNGRVQDAVTGRFLSADPFITEPGNSQNYNRYSYVYNNPLSYVDPSGFESCPPGYYSGGFGICWPIEDVTVTGHDCVEGQGCFEQPPNENQLPQDGGHDGGGGSGGPSNGPSQHQTDDKKDQKPQEKKPTVCRAKPTFARDTALRKEMQAPASEKALVLIGVADVGISFQNAIDEGAGRKLIPGFKLAGGITTAIGVTGTAYSLYEDVNHNDTASALLHGADLTVAGTGLAFPPAAPFALGYGGIRGLGDFVLSLAKDRGSVMDNLPICPE